MQSISKHQLELLKQLNTTASIPFSDISQRDIAKFDYLVSLGYAEWELTSCGVNYNGIKHKPEKISISIHPGGKAFLDYLAKDNFRFRITHTISVLALITAIAAIVLSPFFNAFFTRLYGL